MNKFNIKQILKNKNENQPPVKSKAQKMEEYYKNELDKNLSTSITDNMLQLRKVFSNSSDFITKDMMVSGHRIFIIYCEGLINLHHLDPLVMSKIYAFNHNFEGESSKPEDLKKWIENNVILTTGESILFKYGEIFDAIMSGGVAILIDGVNVALSAGMAGFESRGITESTMEVDMRSSKESFIEPIKINLTMIRRRIKSPTLKLESLKIGRKSPTNVALIYLTDAADPKLVQKIKRKLSQLDIDMLMDSGYLQSLLAEQKFSIFPEIGYTERPDIVCNKIIEGRVAILVDDNPYALTIPNIFIENFQTMDDYTHRPWYASFMRILRILAFFISILLPGLYVAISEFNPEMFPQTLLFNVVTAQESTPFPIMVEAFLINITYELVREASLRLPKQIGSAIGIVGALVIGESAVSSGIIGSPMVIIVALTAITSFIVTPIYQSVCMLKFVFIILGGLGGLYGITLGLIIILMNIVSTNSYNVPMMTPISPFSSPFMQDTMIRRDWKHLLNHRVKVQNMPGADKYLRK